MENFNSRLRQNLYLNWIKTNWTENFGTILNSLDLKFSCIETTTNIWLQNLKQWKKTVQICHKKIDMLKKDVLFQNRQVCPHDPTLEKFYPFCENIIYFSKKFREA